MLNALLYTFILYHILFLLICDAFMCVHCIVFYSSATEALINNNNNNNNSPMSAHATPLLVKPSDNIYSFYYIAPAFFIITGNVHGDALEGICWLYHLQLDVQGDTLPRICFSPSG